MSMLQADEVNVTGQALEKIKNDPAVKEFDQTIIQMAKIILNLENQILNLHIIKVSN